ncbi:MAG: hypothetical protein AB1640_15840 [bacterium]
MKRANPWAVAALVFSLTFGLAGLRSSALAVQPEEDLKIHLQQPELQKSPAYATSIRLNRQGFTYEGIGLDQPRTVSWCNVADWQMNARRVGANELMRDRYDLKVQEITPEGDSRWLRFEVLGSEIDGAKLLSTMQYYTVEQKPSICQGVAVPSACPPQVDCG